MSNENQVVNNSGQGAGIVVPEEVKNRFNWGAFLLGWIWGIGNKSYLTFLSFAALLVCWIPIVGPLVPLGLSIWFGIKGNEWAWQNKKFDSIEAFHNYQKLWVKIGLGLIVLSVILGFLLGILLAGAAALQAQQ